jgi:glycosyltransferase involved in cell wall biosynthesis
VNSSNVDNFPGALVEAACCGLPIVSTRAGGIEDMIISRHNGILVDLNDHEALAAGVIEIVEDCEFSRQLARRARVWAEQFSWQNVLPVLSRVYDLPLANMQEARIPLFEETHRRELVR